MTRFEWFNEELKTYQQLTVYYFAGTDQVVSTPKIFWLLVDIQPKQYHNILTSELLEKSAAKGMQGN